MRGAGALLLVMAITIPVVAHARPTFLAEQLANARVHAAFDANETGLKQLFAAKQLPYPPRSILLRVFKLEGTLELWAQGKDDTLKMVKSYAICANSGQLGPKVIEGDGQVPEGFYSVSVFNPHSAYHLSLGVSYPNLADRARTGSRRPGGAIMIHGNCVTIGCIPLTDPMIEEVYLAAVLARSEGQATIPIHIFPARLDDEGWRKLMQRPETTQALTAFWSELRAGFNFFETTRHVPRILIGRSGHYNVLSH